MAQYEENQIEFAILSLVKDPLIDLVSNLADNVYDLRAIQSQLDDIQPDWRSFTTNDFDEGNGYHKLMFLLGPDPSLGLTEEHISTTRVRQTQEHRFEVKSATAGLAKRKELILAQQGLRMAIQEEIQSKRLEQERASARTRDSGAKMQKFARKVQARKIA